MAPSSTSARDNKASVRSSERRPPVTQFRTGLSDRVRDPGHADPLAKLGGSKRASSGGGASMPTVQIRARRSIIIDRPTARPASSASGADTPAAASAARVIARSSVSETCSFLRGMTGFSPIGGLAGDTPELGKHQVMQPEMRGHPTERSVHFLASASLLLVFQPRPDRDS